MTRHVHADLYEEAINDTGIKWQRLGDRGWFNVDMTELLYFKPELEYRKKPREFKEGHWYPVSIRWGDYEEDLVLKFNGGYFNHDNEGYEPEQFKWIGESLGKLEFGGK